MLLAAIVFLSSCAGRQPQHIGVKDQSLAQCKSTPNCVSSFANKERHQIPALELKLPPEQAWPIVNQLVRSNSAAQIISLRERYLHAEYTSRTMRFIDDLELLVSPDNKRIEVRSASRIGYSDGGVNRTRIESLRAELIKLGVVRK